jgi:hypothetical protein
MRFFIPIFLILLPQFLLSHQDSLVRLRMVQGIMNYRQELVVRNPEGFKKLYKLKDFWNPDYQEEVGDFLLNATQAYHIYGYSPSRIIRLVDNYVPDLN